MPEKNDRPRFEDLEHESSFLGDLRAFLADNKKYWLLPLLALLLLLALALYASSSAVAPFLYPLF
jgi:hypothetical protein